MSIWARPALTLKEATSGAGADSWAGTKLVGAAKVMVGECECEWWLVERGWGKEKKEKEKRTKTERPAVEISKEERRGVISHSHTQFNSYTCEKTWGKSCSHLLIGWIKLCLRSSEHKPQKRHTLLLFISLFLFLCELRLTPPLTHSVVPLFEATRAHIAGKTGS